MRRCRQEIAAIEREISAGHPDLPGLCLALSDWSEELSLLRDQRRKSRRGKTPAAGMRGPF
jgi:hypothetical protein